MYKPALYYLIFLSFIASFLPACGKRGIPEPPSLVVPMKISDLRVDVTPGKRQLAWSLPTENADKSKPVDLKGFKVKLKKLSLDQDSCRNCDEGFYDYLELSLIKPDKGSISGSTFYLPVPQVPHGYVYVFSVLSINSRGWFSSVSNKLSVFSLPEVLPPTLLQCQPSASVVDINWQPPLLPSYFNGHLSYRVYRRDSRDPEQVWQLITPEPIVTSDYIDVGLQDWGSYEYRVTSIVSCEETSYESNFSQSTVVVPGDYTAPAPLENFSAFYYQGGIQLLWNPAAEADLSGYRVYRHDILTGFDRLYVTLPPSQHEFFDRKIISGRTYVYWVTAFDHSARKNESISTPKLSVTVH